MNVNMSLRCIAKLSQEQLAKFVTLIHGSRTPTEAPEWVTLEITRAGFATGEYSAALKDGTERNIQAQVFATPQGLESMQALLDHGNYHIQFPENGALLTAAWLIEQHREEEAILLVSQIAPYMDRLKFFPTTLPEPLALDSVSVASLGDVAETKKQLALLVSIGQQRSARDATRTCEGNLEMMKIQSLAVNLILTTLGEGQLPTQGSSEKNVLPSGTALPFVQRLPSNRVHTAKECLEKYQHVKTQFGNGISRRHLRSGGSTSMLMRSLELLIQQCTSSTQDEVDSSSAKLSRIQTHVQQIVASVLTQRSSWGSPKESSFFDVVAASQRKDCTSSAARIALSRIEALELEQGMVLAFSPIMMKRMLAPMSSAEKQQWHLPNQCSVFPSSHVKAVSRALQGTLDELLDNNILQSAEDIGVVSSTLFAKAQSFYFKDVRLRRLIMQISQAFERRRSLLLLSGPGYFQHQVRVNELPWVVPLLAQQKLDLVSTKSLGHERSIILDVLAGLWKHFPHVLMPNKVSSVLRRLLEQAAEQDSSLAGYPVLEELAADIFGGEFSAKFDRAAKLCAEKLKCSTYSRFYHIDNVFDEILRGSSLATAAQELSASYYGKPTVHNRCSVSANGKIIEAAQILTSHNLLLVDLLAQDIRFELHDACLTCWQHFQKESKVSKSTFASTSQHIRQLSICFRQFIFFLALLPTDLQLSLIAKIKPNCDKNAAAQLDVVEICVTGSSPEFERIPLGWRPQPGNKRER